MTERCGRVGNPKGSALVVVDVLDRVRNGGDLLGRIVRDLDTKLFFERHDQLDDIEAVGTEIVHG